MVIPTYYTVDGSFQLPQLANGSHRLSIGIEEGGPSNRTTWINTIYFTIGLSQPTPTLKPALTPTISPTVTPTVPEFSGSDNSIVANHNDDWWVADLLQEA